MVIINNNIKDLVNNITQKSDMFKGLILQNEYSDEELTNLIIYILSQVDPKHFLIYTCIPEPPYHYLPRSTRNNVINLLNEFNTLLLNNHELHQDISNMITKYKEDNGSVEWVADMII